jgi:serine protease Do
LTLFFLALTALIGSAGYSTSAGEEKKKPEPTAPVFRPATDKLPAAFFRKTPENIEDLKVIQEHVDKLVEKVMPAVVCVRIGATFGSGVVVTKDGYVLTAGHVSGKPDRDVKIYFHNGKSVEGKTLGGNHGIDSGMIKITEPAPENGWPVAEMGDSAAMTKGAWCMVIAHPGGFKTGRTPPVRLGRLLAKTDSTLTTDCVLVGGDSGGPLFDMYGRVIGINSRIGNSLTANMHVPVNPFRDSWDKIAKREVWGGKLGGGTAPTGGYIGVQFDQSATDWVISSVAPGSPAEKAGLKAGDVILKFDSKEIPGSANFPAIVRARKAGDQVMIEIRRGEETLALKIEIGKKT